MRQSKAVEFNKIAKDIFYPIYQVIADQILKQVKLENTGYCLDVGCGPGYLGIAIAKKTEMSLYFYDIDEEALEIAEENIIEASLTNQTYLRQGNVEAIPYPDGAFNLVVSRGSLFFWQDKVKAINEIYRILKPGGWAYLGGGFGNKKLKQMIDNQMLMIDEQWLIKAEERKGSKQDYVNLMKQTKVNTYNLLEGEEGLWIVFKKDK